MSQIFFSPTESYCVSYCYFIEMFSFYYYYYFSFFIIVIKKSFKVYIVLMCKLKYFCLFFFFMYAIMWPNLSIHKSQRFLTAKRIIILRDLLKVSTLKCISFIQILYCLFFNLTYIFSYKSYLLLSINEPINSVK